MPKNRLRRSTPLGDWAVLIGGLLAVLLAVAFGAPREAASAADGVPLAALDSTACAATHCCTLR